MSDSVVRQIVVGRPGRVPGYIVLVAALGGLAVFGLTGLVLGPILASLLVSAWQLIDEAERMEVQPLQPEWSEPKPPINSGETP